MVGKTLEDYTENAENSVEDSNEKMCDICGDERATKICIKCGKHVCTRHFVTIMGLCVVCAPVKITSADKQEEKSRMEKDDVLSEEEVPRIEWV